MSTVYLGNYLQTNDFHSCFGPDEFTLACVDSSVVIARVLDRNGMLHSNDVDGHLSRDYFEDLTTLHPGHFSLLVQLTGQVHRLTLEDRHTILFQSLYPLHRQFYEERKSYSKAYIKYYLSLSNQRGCKEVKKFVTQNKYVWNKYLLLLVWRLLSFPCCPAWQHKYIHQCQKLAHQ